MPDIESRVRRLAQEYLSAFVNTSNLLKDEGSHGKTFMHMWGWIADRYRRVHQPSGLEWNMGESRAVKEFVVQVVSEIVKS